MARNLVYGKQNWPAMGPYLFSGLFLSTMFARMFQGGIASEDGITAHATGGQANAYQLLASFNRVATVASGGDSVALPKAIKGSRVVVDNATGTSMNVFSLATQAGSSSPDTINGTAGTTAFAQAGNKRVDYVCYTTGAWVTSTAALP